MTLIFILVLLGLIAVTAVIIYNSLAKLRIEVDTGWSNIDVQLTRRNDLIPNLVNTVSGYATHEKTTLNEVTSARAASMGASSVAEQAAADNMLTNALGKLFAVAENYPDLKANTNFLDLQNQLTDTEDKIAAARRYYNNTVSVYNTKTVTIPSNIVAKMFGFKQREFYEVENESVRAVPKVEFNNANS